MTKSDRLIYVVAFSACYAVVLIGLSLLSVPHSAWTNLILAVVSAFTAHGVVRMRRQRREGA